MQIIDLSKQNSIINQYMAEMRDKEYQLNRLLFRNNITRVGEMMAYEISKTLNYEERDVETPLGTAKVNVPADKIILATIFRAGLPFHNGFLHVFDHAGNAFVSAYREYKDDSHTEVGIHVEYLATPSVDGKTLIIADPMLATGGSMELGYKAFLTHGTPKRIHVACVIAAPEGIEHIKKTFPDDKTTVWCAAVDPGMNEHKYIVPGYTSCRASATPATSATAASCKLKRHRAEKRIYPCPTEDTSEMHLTTQWASHFFKSGNIRNHLKGYRNGKVEYETSLNLTLYDRDFLGLEWGIIVLQNPQNLTTYCRLDTDYEYQVNDITERNGHPFAEIIPVNHKLLPDSDFLTTAQRAIRKLMEDNVGAGQDAKGKEKLFKCLPENGVEAELYWENKTTRMMMVHQLSNDSSDLAAEKYYLHIEPKQ